MLGSRYNDRVERRETRRQSFFLTPSLPEPTSVRRFRSTGSSATRASAIHEEDELASMNESGSGSVTGVRRHTMIAKTRSLDRNMSGGGGHVQFLDHKNNSILSNDNNNNNTQQQQTPLPSYPRNPQDDYGSTRPWSSHRDRESPLLVGGGGRSKSMVNLNRLSCEEIPHIDEKPLLDVVDRIEDTVEATAYEDLVPLEIKLALENRMFGWSHLTSSILGHILYTAGSFTLAYLILTELYHLYCHQKTKRDPYYEPREADDILFKTIRIAVAGFFALSTFRTIRRRRFVWFRAPYGSKEYQKDAVRRRMTVRETDQTTLLGRLLRKGNEIKTRRVQKKLLKAHKLFQKKHQRQQKESERLRVVQEQSASNLLQGETSDDPLKDSNNEQEILCSPRSLCDDSPFDTFCGKGDDVDDPTQETLSDSASSSDDEAMVAFLNAPLSDISEELKPEVNRNLQVRRQRRATFHTRPTTKTESIMHDQVLFRCGPILNMPYAHGGFFGAAPFMLANPHWISILRHLLPDVYVEISRRVAYAPASQLIHWAENNPVVAAYGVAHALEFGIENTAIGENKEDHKPLRSTPNLEWDVFLSPWHVAEVEAVLQERDKFLSSILPMEHYSFYATHKPLGLNLDDWLETINEDAMASDHIGAKIELTESQRQILTYYADQLEDRAQALVDKMLIAHGKLAHLIYEQLGVMQRYNFSRVKRTRRTLGGGIYARQWMAVYAEALKLGLRDDGEAIRRFSNSGADDVTASIKKAESFMSTSLDDLANAKCPDSSIAESVATIQSILERRGDETVDTEFPVGLVLDIKTRHVSKRVWACVVDTLRAAGVRVTGLASFTVDEIRGISKFCSEPLMEVIFFHSAGDLQRACHEGKIRYGDKVFFNCGSLLWEGTSSNYDAIFKFGFDPEHVKRNYRILPFGRTRKMHDAERDPSSSPLTRSPCMTLSSSWSEGSTIEHYKERYGLSIGLYSQEFAIDDAAANLIVELVNENQEVYDLGFSWGGINGLTIKGIQPGRFTSTDGFWNQRHIGAMWDHTMYPPPTFSSPASSPPDSPLLPQEKLRLD